MNTRHIAYITGASYLVIFVLAIYANFFVLEGLLQDPVATIQDKGLFVRFGVVAFLVAAVCDVIAAWGLYELFKKHALSWLSTTFRIIHATIMGLAVFALESTLVLNDGGMILEQVQTFNAMWLIGLFFFGIHLILLGVIVKRIKFIPYVLMLAGGMYMIDTVARIMLDQYDVYAQTFLLFVAVPAILGEMSFTFWLLIKGGKKELISN